MRRREFLGIPFWVTAAWPIVARGQQPLRIGVLSNAELGDPSIEREVAAFVEELKRLSRNDGLEIRIDQRYSGGAANRMSAGAKEIVALKPNVILARSTPAAKALLAETREIPIVFYSVSDPVGEGLVTSITQPGGNISGFTNLEASMGSKWLELLKEVAPGIKLAMVLYNPDVATSGGRFYLNAIETAALSLAVTIRAVQVRTPAEIESALSQLDGDPNAGLVVTPDPFVNSQRALITSFALRSRIPAVYSFRNMAIEGGLVSYGVDNVDASRRAAEYVDRILRGAWPGALPVQAPTRFELVVNLATGKAMGLKVSETFLLRADEVIE